MLGFCHSWVVKTWKVFKFEYFFLGKKGGDGKFELRLFVTMSCPLGGLPSFFSSLAHSLGSTWKFQSIVVHLQSTPSRNMFRHGFPILLSSFNKQSQSMFFQYTYYNKHFPHWSFCGNTENRYHKTLTPHPSCIFMSSLLLLMPNANIFQIYIFSNLIHSTSISTISDFWVLTKKQKYKILYI